MVFFRYALKLKIKMLIMRKKCPYSELFRSAFSRIRTEHGEIRNISSYSVRMWQNADQNNSEYGHFSHSGTCTRILLIYANTS